MRIKYTFCGYCPIICEAKIETHRSKLFVKVGCEFAVAVFHFHPRFVQTFHLFVGLNETTYETSFGHAYNLSCDENVVQIRSAWNSHSNEPRHIFTDHKLLTKFHISTQKLP